MKHYNVAFLLDESNNWLKPYIDDFIQSGYLESRFSYRTVNILNSEDIFHIVFILGYTKILDPVTFNPDCLYLVIHESDLPTGKGFSPVQWQILEGKNSIKICLFEAAKEVDSGDVYLKHDIEFTGDELFNEIREKQSQATISLIMEFLKNYPSYTKKPQQGEETFYLKRTFQDDKLDINKSLSEQFNHLRIADNNKHPLWFEMNNTRYYIKIFKDLND